MYQFYCFANYVMMLPSLFMSAIGKSCYKRDSFHLAKDYFSRDSWEIVEKMTSVRSLWEEKEGVSYSNNAIPKWIIEIVDARYFEETIILLDEAIKLIKQKNIG